MSYLGKSLFGSLAFAFPPSDALVWRPEDRRIMDFTIPELDSEALTHISDQLRVWARTIIGSIADQDRLLLIISS